MKKLLVTEWRLLLFGFLLSFWSSPGQTYFISLFSGAIRGDLGLTHGEFGGLYSLATLLSAAVIIYSGALVDRIDLRKFTAAIIIGAFIGCWTISQSHSIAVFFVGLFITRHLGQGLSTLTSVTTMVRYLDAAKGKATAISQTGYSFAEAIMPSIVIATMAAIGWRMSWLATGVVLVAIMLPATFMLLWNHHQRHARYLLELDGADSRHTFRRRQWTRAEVVRDKRFYLFMPALLAQSMLFTGFIFHQIHLVESKGWSLTMWGGLFSLYAAVAFIFSLASGFMVDKIGAVKLVPIAPLPLAFALLVLSQSNSPLAAVLFMIFLGLTSGFMNTLSGPFWSQMYGNKHLGSIKSMSTALMVFASSLSPYLLGVLIDSGVDINSLAFGGFTYVIAASALAGYAYSLSRHDPNVVYSQG